MVAQRISQACVVEIAPGLYKHGAFDGLEATTLTIAGDCTSEGLSLWHQQQATLYQPLARSRHGCVVQLVRSASEGLSQSVLSVIDSGLELQRPLIFGQPV
eukprot:2644865-Amphidinium_carterae.1